MALKNISVKKMRVFLSVVETKSFTKAAAQKNISQPAATIIINQIEESAEVELFLRNGQTRKAILTDHGKEVAEVFSRIVGQFDDEIAEISRLGDRRRDPTVILIQDSFADALNPTWLNELLALTAGAQFQVEIEKRDRIIERVSERSAKAGFIDGLVDSNINDYWPVMDYNMSLVIPKKMDICLPKGLPVDWSNVPDACGMLGGLAKQTIRQVRRHLGGRTGGSQGLFEVSCARMLSGIMAEQNLPAIVPSVIAPTICDHINCNILPLTQGIAASSVGLVVRLGERNKFVRSSLSSIAPFKLQARLAANSWASA